MDDCGLECRNDPFRGDSEVDNDAWHSAGASDDIDYVLAGQAQFDCDQCGVFRRRGGGEPSARAFDRCEGVGGCLSEEFDQVQHLLRVI